MSSVRTVAVLALGMMLAAGALAREEEEKEGGENDPVALAAAEMVQKGTKLRQDGKLAEAEKEFTQAIKTYPKGSTSFLGRAQVRVLRKNYRGAIRDFNAYLKRVPNDTRALRQRMETRRNLDPPDVAGACADAKKLLKATRTPPDAEVKEYCEGQRGW